MMKYGFRAEVTLYQPEGLGSGDYPCGEGYSPYFQLPSCSDHVPVRFMDFAGRFDEPAPVTVTLYSGLGPNDVKIVEGEFFQILMGGKTVGEGRVLSQLKEYEEAQNKPSERTR